MVLLYCNLRYSSNHLSYVGPQTVYPSVLNRRQVIKRANFVILIHKVIAADCHLSFKKMHSYVDPVNSDSLFMHVWTGN